MRTICIFIMMLSATVLFAITDGPEKGIVYGKIECNNEEVPYINVFVDGTSIGTTTDISGAYTITNIPEGIHTIKVQGIGFKPTTMEVNIKNGERLEINFTIEEDVFLMEQVVVTSDRNEVNRKEAPVIVNVISPQLFEKKQSDVLIDGLDFTCGVRTECNCQNCGFTQVRMNGLEGPYSQILINSRPIFSGLAGVYGLDLFPVNMIQRIEVVRGGGSALYGGNAIAGTINLITKEPVSNTFQVGGNSSLIGVGHHDGGDPALSRTLKFNGSMVSNDNKAGMFLYGFTKNRDPFDENNDGFTEMVEMNNTSVGFNTYYKPGELSKISLDFYKLKEFRRGGNKLDLLPHESDITEMVDHDITGGTVSFDSFTKSGNKVSVYGAAQFVDRDSYYGALQDETAYGKTFDLTFNAGTQYTRKIENLIFLPAKLTMGADFTSGRLEDQKLGVNGESNTVIANQLSQTIGIIAQNEWHTEKAKFLVGLRYDTYNVQELNHETGEGDTDGSVLIPRASLLYDFTHHLQLRLSYAKGYRAPQIFDEDLHIETSGARRITHSNSPDLIQETSHSYSASLSFDHVANNILFEILVEGFYTSLHDPFANEFTPIDDADNVEYVRVNAGEGAFVTGLNTEINVANMKKMMLQLGFTIQKSEYETAQAWGEDETNTTKSFLRTPDNYGYLTFSTPLSKRFDFSATGTYTGPMKVPHFGGSITSQEELDELLSGGDQEAYNEAIAINEAIANGDIIEGESLYTSENFFDLGIKLKYTVKVSQEFQLEFNAGIENIFNNTQHNHDRGVYRDAGFIYGPCQPRTIFFGVVLGSLF